jgi:ribosomal protein S12 methylthiotransferase
VRESVDAILAAARFKDQGRLRRLIVAGCLVERYREELVKSLPEVDGFVKGDDLLRVGEVAFAGFGSLLEDVSRPYFLYDDSTPRRLSTRPHTAYVKIAEGCDRPCAFCIIPRIRGALRCRESDSVVREVVDLGRSGVREVSLVAQDLTAYRDSGGTNLVNLLRKLDQSRAVDWIRLLYAYPIGIDAELLAALVELPTVCNYLDLPLQHVSEAILQRMKRPLGRYSPRRIVEFIREQAPSVALRTTFIVGLPGESEQEVDELEQFILEGHFSSVGVFTYSPETGTPAAELPDQVSARIKTRRRARLMKAQQRVVAQRLSSLVGTVQEVLVEGAHSETDLLFVGRLRTQAPEVDGLVIINDLSEDGLALIPGTIRRVLLTEVVGYDLLGRALSGDSAVIASRGDSSISVANPGC